MRKELERLKEESQNREQRFRRTVDRLQRQNEDLTKRVTELTDELRWANSKQDDTRDRHHTGNDRRGAQNQDNPDIGSSNSKERSRNNSSGGQGGAQRRTSMSPRHEEDLGKEIMASLPVVPKVSSHYSLCVQLSKS